MTIVTRTFSPRRAVRRSSIDAWARVAAASGAGRLIGPCASRDPRRRGPGRRPRGSPRPSEARRSAGPPPRTTRRARRRAPRPATAPSMRYRASSPSVATVRPGRPAASAACERRRPPPRHSARSNRNRSRTAAPARELIRRPRRHDPPGVDDHDPVRQPLDVDQVVARQQDRGAGLALGGDDRPRRGARLRVHPGGRFVEDQHLGPADERERQPESLPFAARQQPVARPGDRRAARPASSSSSASRGSAWKRPYWTSVSRGRARGSMPPPWSISPTRARNVRPPRAGSTPSTRTRPPSARRYPSTISTVVVLPAPFGPSSATSSPARDLERDAVDHGPPAVALDQPLDDDRRVAAWRHEAILAN